MTRIVFIIILVFVSGCTMHPKFQQQRSADEARREADKARNIDYRGRDAGSASTTDLLRLGRIIQDYLGTPYQGGSRYRDGMDCSEFTQTIFREYNNTQLPRTAREQAGVGAGIKISDLRYGDLLFFRTDGRSVSHVGVYVGYNEFAHSSSSQGVMISNLGEKYWKKRLVGARRVIP